MSVKIYYPHPYTRNLKNSVSYEDLWEFSEYSYDKTAIVVEIIDDPGIEQVGPLTQTKWSQFFPYNGDITNTKKLGRVTVAVGQLMKYFEYPNSINWGAMPYSASLDQPILSQFLGDLKVQLHVDDKGNSTIKEAQNVLNTYSYNTSIYKHATPRIIGSLRKSRPVFCGGTDTKYKTGHAWIIDGFKTYSYLTTYHVFRLDPDKYPKFEYIEVNDWIRMDKPGYKLYSMNWGWGGNHNGWFLDDNLSVSFNDTVYNFIGNRENLIIDSFK